MITKGVRVGEVGPLMDISNRDPLQNLSLEQLVTKLCSGENDNKGENDSGHFLNPILAYEKLSKLLLLSKVVLQVFFCFISNMLIWGCSC